MQLHLQRISTVEKKKKNDYKKAENPPNQKSMFFYFNQRSRFIFRHLAPRGKHYGILQNTYLMLDLLYKHNHLLITTLVDSSIFRKYLRLWLECKILEEDLISTIPCFTPQNLKISNTSCDFDTQIFRKLKKYSFKSCILQIYKCCLFF